MRTLMIAAACLCFCTLVTSWPLEPQHFGPARTRTRRKVPESSYALPVEIEDKYASPPLAIAAHGLEPPSDSADGDKTSSTIVEEETLSHNGTFSIRYKTSNGIFTEMKGSGQRMEGSYSYTAPDGRTVAARWTADENGFHPEGGHLPKFILKSK